jgi:hypothetical protein
MLFCYLHFSLREVSFFVFSVLCYFHFLHPKKKGKGKVVPVLNLIKHYAMKAYGGVDV